MNVTCPECRTVYRVDPAKVIGANVRARCSACGGVIAVSEHVQWGNDFPDSRLAPPRPRATEGVPRRALGGPDSAPVGSGAAPVAEGPGPSGRVPPFAPPRRTAPPSPSFGAPSFPASTLRPPTPAYVPATAPGGSFGAPLPPSPVPAAGAAPMATPRSVPASSMGAPVAARPQPATSVSPEARVAPPTDAGRAAVGASVPSPEAPRRPLNPFLSNDPNQKARRLARALVSDMIAYHPQKREEGVRQGTLKQLFREEIKKSYEEYVEQVGREFAEATSHFQDALNEILAGGKRLF